VLVDDGDAQALYSAVLELVRAADRRRLLAARAFEVAQGFSWDNAAGQFNDVLEGLGT
jgi:glycosyltransferase involved in cell wall biosynthesis